MKNILYNMSTNTEFFRNSLYPGYIYGGKQNDDKNAWNGTSWQQPGRTYVKSWMDLTDDDITTVDAKVEVIETSPTVVEALDDKGVWVGPFIINKTGIRKDKDNTKVIATVNGEELTANLWRKKDSDGNYVTSTNFANIPNNVNFWVRFANVFTAGEVDKITFVGHSNWIYKARLLILGRPAKGGQTISIYRGKYVENEIKADLPLPTGDGLTIYKQSEDKEPLEGFEFKIYSESKQQYIKDDSGKNLVWTEQFSEAKSFRTNASGKTTVNLVKKEDGPFTIIETKAGDPKYEPIKMVSASRGKRMLTQNIDGVDYQIVNGVELEEGKSTAITIRDRESTEDLKIIKIDSQTSKRIPGVEFKIFLKEENKWLTIGGTGTVDLTDKKDSDYLRRRSRCSNIYNR